MWKGMAVYVLDVVCMYANKALLLFTMEEVCSNDSQSMSFMHDLASRDTMPLQRSSFQQLETY